MYEQFKTDFVKKVKQLKVGLPSKKDSDLGALVSEDHLKKVLNYVEKAKQEKMNILYGGEKLSIENGKNGYYMQPTIIEVPSNDCILNQEEIFGPIVTLMPFENDKEALALANTTSYGLSATIWTNNLKRSLHFSEHLETGIVWVNTWMQRDLRTPFGGQKNSGVGREGGFEVLRFFTEAKNICINYE